MRIPVPSNLSRFCTSGDSPKLKIRLLIRLGFAWNAELGSPLARRPMNNCFVDVARDTSFGGSDESRESSACFDGRENWP